MENREIEVKLSVENATLFEVNARLQKIFNSQITSSQYGDSTDAYWLLKDQIGNFARLRKREDGTAELTVKAKDRGNSLNRLEINLNVDNAVQAYQYCEATYGKMSGIVQKQYYVHWLDDHTNVSCYWIAGDRPRRVFVEIEGPSEERVHNLVKQFTNDKRSITIKQTQSLFEMFILPQIK